MEITSSSGLTINMDKSHLPCDESFLSTAVAGWWCGVVVAGDLETEQASFGKRRWRSNSVVHFWADDPVETLHHTLAAGPMASVFVNIKPDAAEALMGDDFAHIQKQGREMPVISATGRSAQIAMQMLGSPTEGFERRLYLSSKAYDLIGSVVAEGGNSRCAVPHSVSKLSPSDIKRVFAARDILLDRLAKPPSAVELGGLVGLGPKKLADGFKQAFDMTLYAFTKEQRLLRARQLLDQGAPSVSSVAYELGYHPAHLSTEFKRRFGIAPSSLTSAA